MHILVAVDGSRACQSAIEFLSHRDCLKKNDSEVDYLNVQYLIPDGIRRQFQIESVDAYYESEGQAVYESMRETLDQAEFANSRELIKSGDLAEVIAEEAQRRDVDMIAMGTRGHSPFVGLLLGSVSTEVLARTQKPVLLVQKKAEPVKDPLRVGIAVDGSRYGKAAVDFIVAHPEFFGKDAEFAVLNVVPDFATLLGEHFTATCVGATSNVINETGELELVAEQQAAFEKVTDPIVSEMLDAGLNVKSVKLDGVPHKALAWYSQENLDMMIIGSHGRGRFEQAVLGSTAMHLAGSTQKPLLVIR